MISTTPNAQRASIGSSDDSDRLSIALSKIGAFLPRELQERYRLAVRELMASGSRADFLKEALRIARCLEQISHDEDEAVNTSPRVSFRTNGMSGSVHRIRDNKNRRRY